MSITIFAPLGSSPVGALRSNVFGATNIADSRSRLHPLARAAALALLAGPLAAGAQDAGPGGQSEPAAGSQPSVTQRVEIAARMGSTELRRAANIAKQIYGREELDRFEIGRAHV